MQSVTGGLFTNYTYSRQRKDMSLYDLALCCIASEQGENINFSFQRLPKVVHIDINHIAYRCNFSYYFALIHAHFDTFVDLLLSNHLNDYHLFVYLRKNQYDSSEYIQFRYLEDPSHVSLGLALGKLLKEIDLLNESELILRVALHHCPSSIVSQPISLSSILSTHHCTASIVSMHILKELLHVYTLQQRRVDAKNIFDCLTKHVLELEEEESTVIQDLASVYNGLASFLLEEQSNIYESEYWNDKALKACDHNGSITTRENIEILLTAVKISRLGFPHAKLQRRHSMSNVIRMLTCLCDSKDSLREYYAAKFFKEVVLNLHCYLDYTLYGKKTRPDYLNIFYMLGPYFKILYSTQGLVSFIAHAYQKTFGEQRAAKVREYLKMWLENLNDSDFSDSDFSDSDFFNRHSRDTDLMYSKSLNNPSSDSEFSDSD